MNNYLISTDKEKLDVPLIHHFLSTQAYWCKGIPLKTVHAAIDHSLNFGIYQDAQQVGFARIVSDYSTVAYLCDVFILPAYRGRGLSKMLVQAVMNDPALQGLRRWILLTGDAHGLYQQFGWTAAANPERWMEIHHKNVYQTSG